MLQEDRRKHWHHKHPGNGLAWWLWVRFVSKRMLCFCAALTDPYCQRWGGHFTCWLMLTRLAYWHHATCVCSGLQESSCSVIALFSLRATAEAGVGAHIVQGHSLHLTLPGCESSWGSGEAQVHATESWPRRICAQTGGERQKADSLNSLTERVNPWPCERPSGPPPWQLVFQRGRERAEPDTELWLCFQPLKTIFYLRKSTDQFNPNDSHGFPTNHFERHLGKVS